MSVYYRTLIQGITDPYLLNQIAHYPFDSNSNDLINGQNGTDTNISYALAGEVGNSAAFNGSSSLISVADNDNFSFGTNPFSINLWNFINTAGNSGQLINKRNSTFIEYQFNYTVSSGVVAFAMYSLGTTAISVGKSFSSLVLPKNAWHMLTITCAGGTGTASRASLRLYVNGVEHTIFGNTGGGTYTGMANTAAGVVFGRQGNVAAGYHNGRLDQTRIWNGRELTPVEVLDIFNTNY